MPAKIQDVHIVAPIIPFKTAYGRTDRVTFTCDPKSLTHQSMAPECDINKIMLKWQKTGVVEHVTEFGGQYGDFTNLPQDYQASMNAVIAAETMFQTLPSSLRKRFDNNPGAFLDFVSDKKNKEELEKLGLAKKPQADLIDLIDDITPNPAKKIEEPVKAPTTPAAPDKKPFAQSST